MADGEGHDTLTPLLAARRRFATMVVHEVRGPLTAAMGQAELLTMADAERDGPFRAGVASDIVEALDHLAAVLDDVLVVTNGPGPLATEPVDLAAALRDGLVGDAHTDALAAALAGAPAVRGDAAGVARILAELIANARAPRSGREQPRLTWWSDDGAVVVDVIDSGPTILAEERTAALDRLDRETSGLRSRRNPGLGVTVARVLAEGMAGSLTIADAAGSGCVFRLRLPQAPAQRSG